MEARRTKRNQSPIQQQWSTIALAYLTGLCLAGTIFFAYNSCLEQPLIAILIPETPERNILVLNVLSQITIFFLTELTCSVFEITRWAFASREGGVHAFTFLVLSRATSLAGVCALLATNCRKRFQWKRDGHWIWGSQR